MDDKSNQMTSRNIRRVVCTGIGVVSPIGIGAQKCWSALLNLKSGITNLRQEHMFQGGQSKIAGYIPDDELQQTIQSPRHSYMVRHSKQLSRPTTLALLAAHEALEDARLIDDSDLLVEQYRESCGVAIGQGMVDFQDVYSNGKLILDEINKEGKGFKRMSPYFMTRALMNMSAGNTSIRYKIMGPNHSVSTACATGAHSIGDAYNFIKTNKADLMVCGSTEATINSISLAGFERLRALCTRYNDEPQAGSRPFDTNRCGFVMGEGAGILILEELTHALNRGIRPNEIYGEILGYGLASDAHNLTAPLPDGGGAKKCMKSAMLDAGVDPSDITHVNAHATSTPLGDDIECQAIEDTFYPIYSESEEKSLTVTSCKSSIGHLLGAAGSVETIFSLLSCRDATLPPCLNLDDPLKTERNLIQLVQHEPKKWNCDRRVLMKNSFGFGGTNASLVVSNFP